MRVATKLRRSRLPKTRSITQIRDDVLWGCLWTGGLAAAAGFVVGLQYLVRGPEVLSGVRITFDQLILAYCVAALVGGIALGLLRPLARAPIGGALLGFLLSMAAYMPVTLVMYEASGVSLRGAMTMVVVLSVVGGVPVGVYFSKHGFGGQG